MADIKRIWATHDLKPDGMIIDDLINTPVKGNKVKATKPAVKTYNTIGVRFLRGDNLHKIYTYKVPKKTKLHLGEEIVVPSQPTGGVETNTTAVVVEQHSTPKDLELYITCKFIVGRILRVAQS